MQLFNMVGPDGSPFENGSRYRRRNVASMYACVIKNEVWEISLVQVSGVRLQFASCVTRHPVVCAAESE